MAKPLHVQLLEILEVNGVSRSIDVSEFLTSNFEKPDHVLLMEWGLDIDVAMRFIKNLQERKLIVLDWEEFFAPIYQGHEESQHYEWFDTYSLGSTITVEGLDYLVQQRILESNKDLNDASKTNAKTQRRFTRTTILIAAAGALASVLTFLCNNPTIRGVQDRIEVLEKENLKRDSIISNLQNPPASLRATYHRGQPSSSDTGRKTSSAKIK